MEDSLIEKNKEYIVNIIDNGYDGEGIAKIDNFTIFVPTAIKGEKCKILIVKVCSTYAYGKIIEILEKSNVRKEEDCLTYKRCGGCSLRHIDYQYTLDMKRNMVQNLINKTLNNTIEVSNTIGMKKPYYYRNKLQYPIGKDKNQEPVMGVFAKRTHEIIPINKCIIQNEKAEEVAKYLFELIKQYHIPIYDEKKHTGTIRHIVIKIGIRTNEIMCIIVTNDESIPQENTIVEKIVDRFPEVKTIIKNINSKNTNVILGKKNIVLYGDGYIYDKLGNYIFKISPLSFYQTNPIQTELLYNKAIEFANLSKEDVLCDLYCGIGTIGIFASKYVNKVYGIEIVPQAIEDAKENAKINDVKNIEFICGDVEVAFDELINKEKIVPSAIIVDPPRKGLDNKTVENIAKIKPAKLVYISCNPATMVRDLTKLENIYNIKAIQPVDMFPWTNGVESITILEIEQ